MFALFFNLYLSMFTGTWSNFNYVQINSRLIDITNGLSEFLTSIFGDNQMTTLGNVLCSIDGNYNMVGWMALVSFILALITSIGIVVFATKGIKRLFTVFFYGVR